VSIPSLSIACVYCRTCIPSSLFTPWTGRKGLVSTFCPGCSRAVTMATRTLRRLEGRAPASTELAALPSRYAACGEHTPC
jgi:hypothetical protein